MKILINEKQYQYIYNTPDRPLLTEITFVENDIPENDDEDNIEVGDGGETKDPHNILYNITEIYVDKHIADLFDELFPLFSDKQKYIHDCDPFVVAFNEKLIEKIKESRLNGAMPKILKSLIVIKNPRKINNPRNIIKNIIFILANVNLIIFIFYGEY